MPRRLVVLTFADPYHAEEARVVLRRLEDDGALDLVNAAVVAQPVKGPRRVSLDFNQTTTGLKRGQMVGLLLAGLFHVFPLIPLGTALGALYGRMTAHIDPAFLKKAAQGLEPGTSALVLLGTQADHVRVGEALHRFRPQVAYSEVPPEIQQEVQEELARLFAER